MKEKVSHDERMHTFNPCIWEAEAGGSLELGSLSQKTKQTYIDKRTGKTAKDPGSEKHDTDKLYVTVF